MKDFSKARRIVVKLGTNVIMKDNSFNRVLINDLARQISFLRRKGMQVMVITSGAIGCGLERMRLNNEGLSLEMQQAAAAVGQNILMHNYEKAFSKYNQVIAQLLVTQYNLANKRAFSNLKRTLNKLLELGIVPIINENDSVATEELIKPEGFSDNDALAAQIASHFRADFLVLVTDVEGLYTKDPKKGKNAKLIRNVMHSHACGFLTESASAGGRGGFKTKMSAAKKALKAGVTTIICKGKKNMLDDIIEGKCTGTICSRK